MIEVFVTKVFHDNMFPLEMETKARLQERTFILGYCVVNIIANCAEYAHKVRQMSHEHMTARREKRGLFNLGK